MRSCQPLSKNFNGANAKKARLLKGTSYREPFRSLLGFLSAQSPGCWSCIDQFTFDTFLGAVYNTVHSLDPFPLRPALQFLGHALSDGHLPDEKSATVLRLLV